MAKREKRALLFGKLGFIGSLIAGLGAVASLILMWPAWDFHEGIIYMPGKLRPVLVVLSLFGTVVIGFFSFLGGLERAAHGDEKMARVGWIAFWLGVLSTMAGIILSICYYAYKS